MVLVVLLVGRGPSEVVEKGRLLRGHEEQIALAGTVVPDGRPTYVSAYTPVPTGTPFERFAESYLEVLDLTPTPSPTPRPIPTSTPWPEPVVVCYSDLRPLGSTETNLAYGEERCEELLEDVMVSRGVYGFIRRCLGAKGDLEWSPSFGSAAGDRSWTLVCFDLPKDRHCSVGWMVDERRQAFGEKGRPLRILQGNRLASGGRTLLVVMAEVLHVQEDRFARTGWLHSMSMRLGGDCRGLTREAFH